MGGQEPGNGDADILCSAELEAYYEQLVLTYQPQLKAFMLRKMGNPQDAEDIVQEALVCAYRALKHYPSQQIQSLKVRPWLYKITWNVYCRYISHLRAVPAISLSELEDTSLLEWGYEQAQPEAAFELVERRHELEALLLTLPQRYREVVRLRYLYDLTPHEIAERQHRPLGTVRVYVHRGVRLLQKAWAMQMSKAG